MLGKEPYVCGMWEYFVQERSTVKRFRELADEEKQARIQGQWQQESPAKEYLEQVKCCHDTDCIEPMMKNGFTALKNGTWEQIKETFRKRMKASEWALCERSCSEARTICAESLRPLEDKEESQCRTCARTATVSLWKATFNESLVEKPQCGGAQFVEKSTTGGNRTGFWSYKQGLQSACCTYACAQI